MTAHEAIWAPLAAGMLLGARWFPNALAGFVCPFHAITGLPCPACGGTRALRALVSGDFPLAFEMSPLAALLGIGAALYTVHALRVLLTRRPWRPEPGPKLALALRIGAVCAIGANWAYLIAVGR